MQERNLKVIEGLLFVLFILLWGLFLSGGSGKVKRRTLSLWQYIPVHTEVFHDFFENSIRKGQYELTPILGYDIKETNGVKKTIMLYILPLNDEEQIHFTGGKFVTPEEIEMNSAQYSSFLKEEVDHLNIVAQMWEEFK